MELWKKRNIRYLRSVFMRWGMAATAVLALSIMALPNDLGRGIVLLMVPWIVAGNVVIRGAYLEGEEDGRRHDPSVEPKACPSLESGAT